MTDNKSFQEALASGVYAYVDNCFVVRDSKYICRNDKSAQKFLGHSDIEVTLEIYTHLSKFKEEQAIRALDEHLKERKKEPEKRLLRVL